MESGENLADEDGTVPTPKETKAAKFKKQSKSKKINGIEEGETSPELRKRPGFENCINYKVLFEKQYEYEGHLMGSESFYARCKACAGQEKRFSFNTNSFKNNGNRHYVVKHQIFRLYWCWVGTAKLVDERNCTFRIVTMTSILSRNQLFRAIVYQNFLATPVTAMLILCRKNLWQICRTWFQ